MKVICLDNFITNDEFELYGVYDIEGIKTVNDKFYYRFSDDEDARYYCEDRFVEYGKIYSKKEILKLLMDGVRIRKEFWYDNLYIHLDEEKDKVLKEDGVEYKLDFKNLNDCCWEVYSNKVTEGLPKEFEWVKSIPWNYEKCKIDCDKLDCRICPFGFTNCIEISTSINKIREKYEF